MRDRVSFRDITPEDRPFLCDLYASTREEELAVVDWSQEKKRSFLEQQFNAQHSYYQKHFEKASFQLILLDDKPIGRLYLDRRQEEIRLIDIALLPGFRGRGIGGALMREILQEGQEKSLPVRIHVEQNNPALKLYRRLGFKPVGEVGIYYLMEWLPEEGEGHETAHQSVL